MIPANCYSNCKNRCPQRMIKCSSRTALIPFSFCSRRREVEYEACCPVGARGVGVQCCLVLPALPRLEPVRAGRLPDKVSLNYLSVFLSLWLSVCL